MPTGISKRQQARNEKTLTELIRTIPGNDRCADCDALTPGWASWNMGVFLCMRCAALHRKLGTHISKVKSLTMDTWTSEQVDNMKSHGNILMNQMNNPRGIRPPIPTDIDEADACMERFIRQKYQHRSLVNGKPKPPSREDSSYSNHRAVSPVESRKNDYNISPDGSPPPLPPKTGRFFKFGLRSSSSTSNLRRFGGKPKVTSPTSPTSDSGAWSPPPLPSRRTTGLGAPVADVATASFESKMAALQDMGFTNDQRNEMVLKGLHEDLDRAVETLIRLGEGPNPSSRSRTPVGTSTAASARIVISKPETSKNPFPVTTDNTFPEVSNNPFDRAFSNPVTQSQTQQPQTASYNPFDQLNPKPASTQPLESSFQNLQVSQPLFPHSTGGYPNQTSSMQHSVYQQSYTPPITSTFSQSPYVTSPQPMDNSYNPFNQAPPQQQGGLASQTYPNPNSPTNPFFNNTPHNQSMQPQQQQTSPLVTNPGGPGFLRHANTMPVMSSASSFGPTSSPQQQQSQQQQPSNGLGAYNPFQQGLAPNAAQNAGGYPSQFQSHLQPQQAQQLMSQPTGMDKNSILSLYNMGPSQSNMASIPEQPQQFQQPQQNQQPQQQQQQQQQQPQQSQPQPQNPTMNPYSQTSNPYTSMPQTQQATNFQHQHQSQPQPQPQPQQNFQPQQPTTNAQPAATTSNNPFFGTATTGSGSGLAAQAGINPYQQQSSGLGIGGMNGQPGVGTAPGTTPATGTNNSPFTGMSSPPFAGSNSSPFAGGQSPFSGPPPSNSAFQRTHMSQPSVDVSGLQKGRHSPDAFASLSARYG
ncbi:Arf GTPase activating protein [Penicillium cf. griseofulvum]|uniref:Arf GTPase activating protein n=1 Tax=Penicillium cf. griseofulvum TaxID=2972120 RepID=A0A9W9IYF3_9EURO|nr:Arf GTPase activating protein [Penicillium cf. griseofulvum]KAJ5430028.1 Arf GTPase activating protein [Penicillium cf. griseofulvum]KAJ5436198.1 Arf GTPase activating protein [Penicillium cf. griseofulvum]